MKQTTIAAEKLTVKRLLGEAGKDKAVFLTVRDKVRFVLLPADDGDQEVCALQSNAKFMAYLQECVERGKTGRRYTLEEIKAEFGLPEKTSSARNSAPQGTRRTARKTA